MPALESTQSDGIPYVRTRWLLQYSLASTDTTHLFRLLPGWQVVVVVINRAAGCRAGELAAAEVIRQERHVAARDGLGQHAALVVRAPVHPHFRVLDSSRAQVVAVDVVCRRRRVRLINININVPQKPQNQHRTASEEEVASRENKRACE